MSPRRSLVLLLLLAPLALGTTTCPGGGITVVSDVEHVPGSVEPHTPGSGDALEFPAPDKLVRLLGPEPDLNVVSYVRTRTGGPSKPRAVLILIPGFLGGAATFGPLARQLVALLEGDLEVWAVDRRPNLLEDRRGALHASLGTPEAIAQGTRFHFPGADVDGDGSPDPPFLLPDALGDPSGFLRFEQDDVRFLAHWGVDTYVRDWKILAERARERVGPDGLVLFGGHSLGTAWAGLFAAYDFDPGPGVDAGHARIDGLILLEGGGPGPGAGAPSPDAYREELAALERPGGPDVYLRTIFGLISVIELGAGAELTGIAGTFDPTGPAIIQRTPFGASLRIVIQADATNRSIVGFFLDDDFSPNPAFRASLGFSDDGVNAFLPALDAYVPLTAPAPRDWKNFDEPQPSCPPNLVEVSPGCSILDNGPKPAPGAPPAVWGVEREVTDMDDLLALNFTDGNFAEWYFVGGRASLDLRFGRDSSALGDERLLAVTRNASVDVPVLCIGGSNGLTPTEESFASYLGSIATPPLQQEIVILEGYAHLDVLTAAENEAVAPIAAWVERLLASGSEDEDTDSDSERDPRKRRPGPRPFPPGKKMQRPHQAGRPTSRLLLVDPGAICRPGPGRTACPPILLPSAGPWSSWPSPTSPPVS